MSLLLRQRILRSGAVAFTLYTHKGIVFEGCEECPAWQHCVHAFFRRHLNTLAGRQATTMCAPRGVHAMPHAMRPFGRSSGKTRDPSTSALRVSAFLALDVRVAAVTQWAQSTLETSDLILSRCGLFIEYLCRPVSYTHLTLPTKLEV